MASAHEICVDLPNGSLYILARCNQNFIEDARANARRIIACVNACEGRTTEELEATARPAAVSEAVAAAVADDSELAPPIAEKYLQVFIDCRLRATVYTDADAWAVIGAFSQLGSGHIVYDENAAVVSRFVPF